MNTAIAEGYKMTCIAAIIDRRTNKVWMGADSLVSGNFQAELAGTKVWKQKAGEYEWLCGIAGPLRFGQLVQHSMDFDEDSLKLKKKDFFVFLQTDYARILESMIKDHLFDFDKDKGVPKGRVLIGAQGRLFMINSALGVTETSDSYASIGEGEPHAMALMWDGHRQDSHPDPKSLIKKSIRCAKKFCGGVGGRTEILSL